MHFLQRNVTPKREDDHSPSVNTSWSLRGDSNSRPTHYECVALPTELPRRGNKLYLINSLLSTGSRPRERKQQIRQHQLFIDVGPERFGRGVDEFD